ncbi:MAG: ABC transporter ATP-binding protein [Burkholderiaceae bacterium]|nr:ABC transporter ATP-binding protein [Burkholderiaceae bacterium]
MMNILQLDNVSASYGRRPVLFGINLEVRKGGITTLLGANGAGKTSTLRAICNLMLTTTGSIQFDGQPISKMATEKIVRLGVGHVPDGRGTFTHLSVEENLRLGALARDGSDGVDADFEQIFTYFPRLRERRHQQAGTLSGGEQQMLAISRALMMRPRLLLLDEPSFGVAPLVVNAIFDVLKDVNARNGTSILLVEQNAELALACADLAFVIESGHIVLSGPAEEIRNDAAVRRSYLGY